MRLLRTVSLALMAVSVLLVYGCASLESEKEPDWRTSEDTVEPLANTYARADGSRLAIGNTRSVLILDGEDGEALSAMGDEGFVDWVRVTLQVKGTTLLSANLRPDMHNTRMLEQANLLLVFDYEGTRERITALDMDSGAQRWQVEDLDYSLQQYEETLRQLDFMVSSKLSEMLGGTADTESATERRERHRDFAEGLARAVDGGDALVVKTFDGLVKLDAAAGEEIWRVEDFEGPGILELQELADGDYLVLSRGRNLSNLQAADNYHLARITPEGQLKWISEHSGRGTTALEMAGDRAFVQGKPMEVFSLSDGNKLWSSPEGWGGGQREEGADARYRPEPDPLITESAVYQAAYVHGEDGGLVTSGFPHRIRSLDARSGELNWETDRTDTYFGDLKSRGDQLIVWGAGDLFGEEGGGGAAGLERDTGEILWRTPEMATPGIMSKAQWVVEPVFDQAGEHLYIAGPEALYGVRLENGETVLSVDLTKTETDAAVGLARHGDQVVVVGDNGVAAFDSKSGEKAFDVATHPILDFHEYGDRLILEVAGSTLEKRSEGEPDNIGLVSLDPDHGATGDLIAWKSSLEGVDGVFADGRPVITREGEQVFIVDDDGRLHRYSLQH